MGLLTMVAVWLALSGQMAPAVAWIVLPVLVVFTSMLTYLAWSSGWKLWL